MANKNTMRNRKLRDNHGVKRGFPVDTSKKKEKKK